MNIWHQLYKVSFVHVEIFDAHDVNDLNHYKPTNIQRFDEMINFRKKIIFNKHVKWKSSYFIINDAPCY